MERITIRRMSHADLLQVHAIEKESFSIPWSINLFKYEVGHKESIFMVAAIEKQVIGYVCLRTILDVTNVMNLAVLPELRRKGIGSMLLQDALQELRRLTPGVKFVTLEVRESSSALSIYEKAGFSIIGRRKDYYNAPEEDAIMMGLERA